ncbi:MAG TPA: hypothetical protein VLJ61_14065 [Pyrinomonadaceae bacterium]|nr:hypothetical protein [Pyrinomonadaceae bacterium]
MSEEKKYTETFEVRLTQGREGSDPEAPDWEVVEVKDGVAEVACDNMTQSEANHMADMWSRKRDEAEAEA